MDGHQRQREQSGKMIEEALFSLMAEKEFGEITVSELVRRADVARRTFYRLYDKKEDVLKGYFRRLCEQYQNTYPALEKYDLERIAKDFFSFWYSHKDFLLLLHNCGMEEMLYSEIRNASVGIVRNRISGNSEKETIDMEYFAYYSAGGFLMLLYRWISDGMEELPESYAKKTSSALLKLIRP